MNPRVILVLLVVASLISLVTCLVDVERNGNDAIPDEDWGYVETDSEHDSHMFWWMYGAQDVSNRTNAPLVLWLQGGPGASSWMGDLVEFGPLDPFLKPREFTWAKYANLIFIDNPVGTGFSYVGKGDGFRTTQSEIAADLLTVLKGFFKLHPSFLKYRTPFWIFAESYGPRYASSLGVLLINEIKKGNLNWNFQGVGLGDGWLSPMDCVNSYAPFMKSISIVNEQEYQQVLDVAANVQYMLDHGEAAKAGIFVDNWVQGPFMEKFWPDIENFVFDAPDGYWAAWNQDMAGPIRDKLKIPANVSFGGQGTQVGNALAVDFLLPVYDNVDFILNNGYQVAVYAGQFDIVVDILCTNTWIQKLKWKGLHNWNASPKEKFADNTGRVSAFRQNYENFTFWNILRAGHMVPMDAPNMAYIMFNNIVNPNLPITSKK